MNNAHMEKSAHVEEQQVDEPPDGGLVAWSQVLASHLTMFNSWGYMTSFGIFQPYYVKTLNQDPSNISWIGSLEYFCIFFMGFLAGRAADAGYVRTLLFCGFALQILGVFTTSACNTYWQFLLAQGVCQGLGCGLTFTPMVSLVSSYFKKKRVLAICIQASGTSSGGLVFPAIAKTLLPSVGFPWAVRAMGFVIVFNSAIILLLVKPRLPPRKNGRFVELSAFKEPTYLLYTIGIFLALWGNFVAYFYLRAYAKDIVHVSEDVSFNMLLVMNGIGIPGRLIPSLIADRLLGPVNTISIIILLAGVMMSCWITIKHTTSMWIFSVFYGLFSSAIQGLFPAALASLTLDPTKQGLRIGMACSVFSFACLSGSPIAGHLIEIHNGQYLHAQIFGLVNMFCGCAFVVACRTARCGLKIQKM